MFTGIIEEVGVLERVEAHAGLTRLEVRAPTLAPTLRSGDSIALNGACLTVVEQSGGRFTVELVPETLRRTALGEMGPGGRLNLERPLLANGRFGGHVVQGHVEDVGVVEAREAEGEALNLRIAVPPNLRRYLVPKGFVAVDGVSLTVVDCDQGHFTVTVIPYTQKHTTLAEKRPGSRVNLETDVMARYLEGLVGG